MCTMGKLLPPLMTLISIVIPYSPRSQSPQIYVIIGKMIFLGSVVLMYNDGNLRWLGSQFFLISLFKYTRYLAKDIEKNILIYNFTNILSKSINRRKFIITKKNVNFYNYIYLLLFFHFSNSNPNTTEDISGIFISKSTARAMRDFFNQLPSFRIRLRHHVRWRHL